MIYQLFFIDSVYHLFVSCRGPGVPKTFVVEIEALADHEKMQTQLENLDWILYFENEELQNAINTKSENWPIREFNTYQSENWPSKPYNYELFMPRNIDESKKYALLVFVYGAPEYQNVDQLFTTDFVKAYLPSSYNVITAL